LGGEPERQEKYRNVTSAPQSHSNASEIDWETMNKQVLVPAGGGRTSRKPRATSVAALALGAALIAPFGLVATAGPANAATGDTWPLDGNKAVNIDAGALYASEGGSITKIKFDGGKVTQENIANRYAPTYWAGNLGLGPDASDPSKLAFMGSRWNASTQQVYRVKDGDNKIEEVGQSRRSPTGVAWGGSAVDGKGMYWQGTNLASPANTRISRFDPTKNTTTLSGKLVAPASDRVWNGGYQVAPDYAFDVQGNFYGLMTSNGSNTGNYIYKYDVSNFTEGAEVPVSQAVKVEGLPYAAGYYYGFAWLNGKWYAGQSNGDIYVIDPGTGQASKVATKQPGGNGSYSYRLQDLASGGLVPINPAGDAKVKKESDVPLRIAMVSNQVLNYTLTYTNDTLRPTAVDEFDDMSRVLDDATVNSQPVSDNAALQVSAVSGNRFTIKGTIDPGQTVQIKYSVKVNQPSNRGDNRMTNFVLKDGETAPQFCIASNSRCADNRTATSITG
jgi:hypothetical protein